MQYNVMIKKDGSYADLVFTRKNGKAEEIYLGYVKEGALADQCLGKLYDFHQCDDEFKDGDEILVPNVGTFKAISFHIVPADEDTRLACMGVTKKHPYRIAYEGMDGNASTQFVTLEEAAKYVKDRWQGIDYMDTGHGFHNDHGRFVLFGFVLKDIGKVEGEGVARTFVFNN